ncbi:MAG: T9SS type A sorting domain-containing protein [Bacteroidota bacterium]|jgi:hypothetical protein|nr:T9SS type A sorting domain-containing protein [Sphingobacteriales bacterium]
MKKSLLFLFIFCTTISIGSYAQTTWNNLGGTGIFSDDGNWTAGQPDGFNNIIFDGNETNDDCFIDANSNLANSICNINFINGYSGTVTLDDNLDLEVNVITLNSGSFVLNTGSSLICNGLNFGTGALNRTFDGTNASSINIFGNLSFGSGTGTRIFNASSSTSIGTIISGAWTVGSGGTRTFNHNNGLFKFSAVGSRSIPDGVTFHRLELFSASSSPITFTLGASVTVNNRLVIAGSNSSSVISFAGGTINLAGELAVPNHLATTPGGTLTGTINFNGTTAQSIVGSTTANAAPLPRITISNTSAAVTLSSGKLNVAGAFTISAGATFVSGGNELTFQGNVTNSGTFTPSTSTINLAGANAQSIDFRNAGTMSIANLISSKTAGTATISDAIEITDLLTSTGGGTINLNGNVTLVSTSGKTAQIGACDGATPFSGNANIQRFIPSRSRTWRFLAAPVTSGSGATIRNNWQSQMFITGGSGGTGPVGTSNFNADGFDWTASNSASMFTYNESAGGVYTNRWASVGNPTSTNLSAGVGYRVFIRGDRSDAGRLDGTNATQNAVTLSVTGTPATGPLNVSVSKASAAGTDGWNLVGNPFAATIDFDAFRATNSGVINNLYYTLNVGGAGYVSWNGSAGAATRFIPSGQSFWVFKTAAGTTNITFNEAHKSTSSVPNGFFKNNILPNLLSIILKNLNDSSNNYSFIHYRNDANNDSDAFDASKLGFGLGQLASYNNGSTNYLDINSKHTSALLNTDTVNLFVNQSAVANNFRLIFDGVNSFAGAQVFLHDLFQNSLTNLSGTSTYNFTTSTNTASTGAGRFKLYFAGITSSLPVEYLSFKANRQGEQALLNWSTAAELNNSHFELEKSLDNKDFKSIGLIKGSGTSNMENNYSFIDETPSLNMTNYYRIKQVDLNGQHSYSLVLPVNFNNTNINDISGTGRNMMIFPVPASNILNISTEDTNNIDVSINIYDIAGALLISTETVLDKKAAINIESLTSGIYFIEIRDGNQTLFNSKFIKN